MSTSLSSLSVRQWRLNPGDTVEVPFSYGAGFLIISQPNWCHVNFGQSCSSTSSSSCRWFQSARSNGSILLGTTYGIAEIVVTTTGTYRITAGHLRSASCWTLNGASGIYSDWWDIAGPQTDCIVQSATSGRFLFQAGAITSSQASVTVFWSDGTSQSWSSSSSSNAYASEAAALMFVNSGSTQYRFQPASSSVKLTLSLGSNISWNYPDVTFLNQEITPVIYVGTQNPGTRLSFSEGRYTFPRPEPDPTKVPTGVIDGRKGHTGVIIGIVVSVVVVVIAIVVVVIWVRRERRRNETLEPIYDGQAPTAPAIGPVKLLSDHQDKVPPATPPSSRPMAPGTPDPPQAGYPPGYVPGYTPGYAPGYQQGYPRAYPGAPGYQDPGASPGYFGQTPWPAVAPPPFRPDAG